MKIDKKLYGTVIGNVMEFYDFTIYAYLAAQIGKSFFPAESSFVAMLLTLSIFAGGYLTRPLGSLFFGYIGDRNGRKSALMMSVGMVTLTTILIGLLPGYSMIGIAAPVLLLLLRLVQGFSVSGEEGGAAVYMFESENFKKKGLVGSYIMASILAGVLLGSFVCLLISSLLSSEQLSQWGWRIPFILSLPLGIVSLVLRLKLAETEVFTKAKKQKQLIKNPAISIFNKGNIKQLLVSVVVVASYAVTTSILIVYMPHFLVQSLKYTESQALAIETFGIIIATALLPFFGKLSDKVGYFQIARISLLLLAIFSPIMFYSFASSRYIELIILIAVFSTLISMFASSVFAIIVKLFPLNVRYTGTSLSFNLSITLFSGSAPLVIISLSKATGLDYIAGLYLCGFTLISLAIICMTEKSMMAKSKELIHERA